MKKLAVLSIFLLSLSSLFALPPFPLEGEKVEVKGTIANFEEHPVALVAEGTTYYLMVPRFLSAMVPDGAEVAVEGVKLDESNSENCPIALDEGKEYIMVTKITYKDVTVDLEKLAAERQEGRRGQGRGNGRGQGRGRGGRGCGGCR